jgi:hypothetical protein
LNHKKYLCSILAESILHGWPTFSAHSLALKKETVLKMSAQFNIFSQEVWVQDLMALG